jgi:hypothetical protein
MLPSYAAPRVTARAEHTCARVERRLRRYPSAVQTAVRASARVHPHVADLAVSFPALLFAVATTRRDADRARLIAAVVEGEPLAHVAVLAGIPSWLRKLPPETFTQPISPLPDGALFRRQIANHLPASVKLSPVWLDAVSRAALWGHEGLAVWLARELTRDPKRPRKLRCLNAIALWAWYSAHVSANAGFVTRPWHPSMRFETARAVAGDWRTRVALHLNIGTAPISDTWLQPAIVGGFEFVPLDTGQVIADEAAAMNNCLCGYGPELAHNCSRLWGIRKDGTRVADVSIVTYGDDPLPSVGELRLANNKEAPLELWLIARTWLNGHDLRQVNMKRYEWGAMPLDGRLWRSFWRPYWLAKRCFPAWLPLAPSRPALQSL